MAERPNLPIHTPPPDVTPDHAFVPLDPKDRYVCWHVVFYAADGRPVRCNLARRYHPILEDEHGPPPRRREPPQRGDQP